MRLPLFPALAFALALVALPAVGFVWLRQSLATTLPAVQPLRRARFRTGAARGHPGPLLSLELATFPPAEPPRRQPDRACRSSGCRVMPIAMSPRPLTSVGFAAHRDCMVKTRLLVSPEPS